MAYVVGSVSVEVVPDFRNAQNAITAWFKSQPDSLKIPVKPEFDTRSNEVEQQAARLGTRVSKAMNDAAARNQSAADKLALQMAEGAEKSKLRAHAEAIKIHARLERERLKQEKEIADLGEAIAAGRDKARLQAHAEALRINERMTRESIRSELAAERDAAAEKKRIAAEEIRTAERIAAEELKIERDAIARRTRLIEEEARTAYRIQVDAARKTGAAIRSALGMSRTAAAQDEKLKLQIEIDERQAIKDGQRVGGLVARAVRQEVHQNAGLIAAAIGAALIAGAPVALAGATALFAGVGAVAAAQSQRVRSAWVGAWDEIRSSAISDAAVLVPTFERMAGSIAASFQRMRPALRDAFAAVGPQLDLFTDSLTRAAENALPGLVRAVQAGGPVIQGLGNFLEDVGTGLSNFFDILAKHAPASGEVFSDLGQSVAALLPSLAELLGQGAELATLVLPAVNGALGALLAILQKVGPALPVIGAGFLAFRAANGAGTYLSNFGAKLQLAEKQGGLFATSAGRAGRAISAVGSVLPGIGIAVGIVAAAMADGEQQIDNWARAMLEGGAAAGTARSEINAAAADAASAADVGASGLILLGAVGMGLQTSALAAGNAMELAEERADALYDAMSPLEQKQQDVATASNQVEQAIKLFGSGSGIAATAAQNLARKEQILAAAMAEVDMATRGVTEAMVAQANQARALSDSSFAYEQALLDLTTAQEDYNTALNDPEASEQDKAQALLDLSMAYGDVASAARDVAYDALPAMLAEKQKNIIADQAELESLQGLKEQYGDLGPILENRIAELSAATGGANENALAQANLSAALQQVGLEVESIPGEKSVIITAPTEDQKQRLRDLGFTVTEIPGSKDVRVSADTAEAEANLGKIDTELAGLDDTTAVPEVEINDIPFFGGYRRVMAAAQTIHMQRPTPQAFLRDSATPPLRSLLSFIGVVGGQRPTPQAFLRDNASSPLRSLLGTIGVLGSQRPSPVASLVDRASGGVASLLGLIRSIPASTSTTATFTTIYRTIGTPRGGAPVGFGTGINQGGAVEDAPIRAKFGIGGAVVGRGGALDDLVPALGPIPGVDYSIANGEHILDGADVARMGGQAGVYAFREMLSSGKLGANFDVRRVVASAGSDTRSAGTSSTRDVTILTSDNPKAIVRAMRAEEQQRAALAPAW